MSNWLGRNLGTHAQTKSLPGTRESHRELQEGQTANVIGLSSSTEIVTARVAGRRRTRKPMSLALASASILLAGWCASTVYRSIPDGVGILDGDADEVFLRAHGERGRREAGGSARVEGRLECSWCINGSDVPPPSELPSEALVIGTRTVRRKVSANRGRPNRGCRWTKAHRPHFAIDDEYEDDKKISTSPPIRRPPRVHSYAVVNVPRSGSTYLQNSMVYHPSAWAQFELNVHDLDDALVCRQCKARNAVSGTFNSRLTDSEAGRPAKSAVPTTCGASCFLPHGDEGKRSLLEGALRRRGGGLVVLLRRNHAARAMSLVRKFVEGTQMAGDHRAVDVSATKMYGHMARSLRAYEWTSSHAVVVSSVPVHIVWYSALVGYDTGREVLAAIQDFVGLERMAVNNTRTKDSVKSWHGYLKEGVREKLVSLLERLLANGHLDELQDEKWEEGGSIALSVEQVLRLLEQTSAEDWDHINSDLKGEFLELCRQRYEQDRNAAPLSWYKGVCVGGNVTEFSFMSAKS